MAPRKSDPLKKQEKPLVCFVRLYGTEKKRMENLCRKFSTTHNDVAKAGIGSEILRREQQADELDPAVALAATELRRLGGDPLGAIRDRIAQTISPLKTE